MAGNRKNKYYNFVLNSKEICDYSDIVEIARCFSTQNGRFKIKGGPNTIFWQNKRKTGGFLQSSTFVEPENKWYSF